MWLKMATETKNQMDDKLLETQELNVVCENLQFLDDNIKLPLSRKRCVTTPPIVSSSPKKKKRDGQNILIPPKKFLLGGNISDPLNLNSLQNEDINKAMNKTPKSSPLHSNTVNIKMDQVNVIIPRNLSDPLELSTCVKKKVIGSVDPDAVKQKTPLKHKQLLTKSLSDSVILAENGDVLNCDIINNEKKQNDILVSSIKKTKIESSKNYVLDKNCTSHIIIEVLETIIGKIENGGDSVQSINTTPNPAVKDPDKKMIEPQAQNTSLTSSDKNDKLSKETFNKSKPGTSSVTSQVSLIEKLCKPQKASISEKNDVRLKQKPKNEPKFKEKNAKFKYGNYNRYYGYRNPDDEDHRLKVLAECMDLFYGKDVLDIGCNIGHVTLSVARDFGAKSIVGMDIDRKLINIARKNIQYYINDDVRMALHANTNYQFNDYTSNIHNNSNCDTTQSFPASMSMLYGPINLPGMTISGQFPYNVSFIQGNYVLESDDIISMETCKFDVILCLSITKWLHLNWGDVGLKRAFKRMYAQLRPGGILVVEPQPWKSYGRRKTLTETIWRNYKTIQLKPPMFTEYLLKEVGFANCETLALPHNPSKGFQRPLKLYRKLN